MSDEYSESTAVISELPSELSVLLDDTEQFLARFVAYPSQNALVAHTLWIVHTHCMPEWESTPRIAFLSPEPASGKTRALEITETLVPRPVEAINVTPAYLFRKVADEEGLPTILFDEVDTVFGPKAKDNEEIRGVLNAGHRRGATAGRCVARGSVISTEELPAFCAVAVAGLGNLPDTILSRSVIVRMRRRGPAESVEQYRRRIHSPEGHEIRDRLASWAASFSIEGVYPEMPDGVEDRAADVYEPLIAIADAAGKRWSERARVAAVALVAEAHEDTPSLGIRLLEDLHTIFSGKSQLPTTDILDRLANMEEAPWGDLKGRPLDPRRLAHLLRPYNVRSRTIRQGATTLRGYTAEDLQDAWDRYVPPPPAKSKTSETGETVSGLGHEEFRI